MRSIKKIIIYLIISLVILLGLTVVDYIFVKSKNTFPRIAIKEENKKDDAVVYRTLLYKLYYCTSNGSKEIVLNVLENTNSKMACMLIYLDLILKKKMLYI